MFAWFWGKKKKTEVKATILGKQSETKLTDKSWREHISEYQGLPEFENECNCECDDHDCFFDEDCGECDCHDDE